MQAMAEACGVKARVRHRFLALGLLAAAAANAPAFAQQAVRPGLWQLETRMPLDPEFEESMAEMREELASMSPQERRQMEAMMGKRGAQLAPGAKGGKKEKTVIESEARWLSSDCGALKPMTAKAR
jgi:hypothetical protein